MKAEHFFDFYLQDLDLSQYPKVEIKGGVIIYYAEDVFFSGKVFTENILLSENDDNIDDISVVYTPINKNLNIFTLTYTSNLPKEAIREFLLAYDENGFHNGSDGQKFEYNPAEHTYMREIDHISEADEEPDQVLANYINTFLIDYERDGLQEMYVLARNGLRIREAPTTDSKVIGKLDFGQEATVSLKQYGDEISVIENKEIDLKIDGKFRKINVNGQNGYVFDGYLTAFSFLQYLNQDDPCDVIDNIPEMIETERENRVTLDYDTYGRHFTFTLVHLQEVYLLAQAIFGDFQNLNIEEQQDYGEIFNGWEHYVFENSNYTFKILKFKNNNDLSYYSMYFECSY